MQTRFLPLITLLALVAGLGLAPELRAESGRAPSFPRLPRDRNQPVAPSRSTSPTRSLPERGGTSGLRLPVAAPASDAGQPPSTPASSGDEAAAKEETAPPRSTGQRIRSFIRNYYGWILAALAVALGGVVAWHFVAGRGKRGGSDYLATLDAQLAGRTTPSSSRFSSTKIRASDVNDRLGAPVRGTEIETDREYALVVEEEALRRPLPGEIDERTGREYVNDAAIRNCLDEKDFDGAYGLYCGHLDEDGGAEFHGDVEKAMSEHFLRRRDFRKAAHILEHHVATHARESIDPEVYFNLGYIHFLTRTFNKSRRFLRLFVESEKNPRNAARAKSILTTLNRKLKNLS